MVIMVIMVIRAIRVTSGKSMIGILTHQGHISKVNENAHSLSDSVTLITSRASCDAKKGNIVNKRCCLPLKKWSIEGEGGPLRKIKR